MRGLVLLLVFEVAVGAFPSEPAVAADSSCPPEVVGQFRRISRRTSLDLDASFSNWKRDSAQQLQLAPRAQVSAIVQMEGTPVYGKLSQLKIAEDYSIFSLKDARGTIHYFDSAQDFPILIEPGQPPRFRFLGPKGAESKALREIKKTRHKPVHSFSEPAAKERLCRDFSAIQRAANYPELKELVKSSIKTRKTWEIGNFILERCVRSMGAFGAAYSLYYATFVARLIGGIKNEVLNHASNYYMSVPLMAMTHRCLAAFNPTDREMLLTYAVGVSTTANALSEGPLNGLQIPFDVPDFYSGMSGVLTYLVLFQFFEDQAGLSIAQLCGR